MKRTLKYALLASAAAFVLGMAAPSQAQQYNMRAPRATSQSTYQPGYANRVRAESESEYAPASPGVEAYDYMPAPGGYSGDSCATQGTYGQGVDYANCY